MKGFSFHDAAEAARYYETCSPGLGGRFLAATRSAVEYIRAFPEAAPQVRGTLRRRSVKGFPYNLIYAVEADIIVIYAVQHHRKRPEYWMGRIKPPAPKKL
jgi:plasmid stabilization system protein ParE